MDINGTNGLTSLGKEFRSTAQVAGNDRRSGTGETERDKVDLSNFGKGISRFTDLINATPGVRESWVEKVRSLIEGGTYDVKAEQVAEKIMGGDLLNETF